MTEPRRTWLTTLASALGRKLESGDRIQSPPSPAPALDPADLARFVAAWPEMKRVVQRARAAGFEIEWGGIDDPTIMLDLSRVAASAGVSTLDQLDACLVRDVDGYFRRLMYPSGLRKEGWTVDRDFIFALVVVRSLVDRLSVKTLTRYSGWHRSIAKRALQAAQADALEATSSSARSLDEAQGPDAAPRQA